MNAAERTGRRRAAETACRVLWPEAVPEGFAARLAALARDAAPERNADRLNALCGESFGLRLRETLFDALAAAGVVPAAETAEDADDDTLFLLKQAQALLALPALLLDELAGCSHLRPAARRMLAELPEPAPEAVPGLLAAADPFGGGRAFRYLDGRFEPADLDWVRPADAFFGFPGVQRIFREQFDAFANGQSVVPLLISSLPGHGKTQLTIAHTLARRNLTLVLAPASALEAPLEGLLAALRRRPDRRFVVFFDDIDPAALDWYTFRTNVGGSFTLPAQVMLAAASNYEFPASILSRGRSVVFPTFDDVRCQEMIEEFLARFGFRRPNPNLISLIAAGYTEEFGQKRFTELSPRTLMRYLKLYEDSRQKRRDAIQLACGAMITKPDPELFYEFNIKLMRKLYGDGYIENLLKERLKTL